MVTQTAKKWITGKFAATYNKKIVIKLLVVIMICSLPLINLHAQKEYRDITSTLEPWENYNDNLTIHTNNLSILSVENTKRGNNSDITYGSMVKTLDIKTDFRISFEMDMKANSDDVYWGVMFELYTIDGSTVNDVTWYNKKEDDICSINRNDTGWERCFNKTTIMNLYHCPPKDDRYSISMNNSVAELKNGMIETQGVDGVYVKNKIKYSHIAGIRTISIIVGAKTKITIKNFTVEKKTESTKISSDQIISNQQKTSADEYVEAATFYSRQNNYNQAIIRLKKALELNSNHYWANNNIGYIYFMTEEYALGIPYLQKAINIEPDNPFAYSNLGGIYTYLGEYKKAIDYCKRAIDIKEKYNANLQGRTRFDFGEPYYYLGLAYAGLNDVDNSLYYLTIAARLGDENAAKIIDSIKENTKTENSQTSSQQKKRPAQNTLKKDPNFKIK